jgi:hypothetical protein
MVLTAEAAILLQGMASAPRSVPDVTNEHFSGY